MAEGGQKRDPVNHKTKAQAARANKKHGTTPSAKADRAARNRARRKLIKAGKLRKGDPRDAGHIKGLAAGGGNGLSNLKPQKVNSNRAHNRKVKRRTGAN